MWTNVFTVQSTSTEITMTTATTTTTTTTTTTELSYHSSPLTLQCLIDVNVQVCEQVSTDVTNERRKWEAFRETCGVGERHEWKNPEV